MRCRNPEKAFVNLNLGTLSNCLITVVALHGDRRGLAIIELQHGYCVRQLRGSSFPVWWLGHSKKGTERSRLHLMIQSDNSDTKECLPSRNCMCFVLERRKEQFPESPLLCSLDKDWLAYLFLCFLKKKYTNTAGPESSWSVWLFSPALPQLACTFARVSMLSRWTIPTLLIFICAAKIARISILLCCCSDLIVGCWEILFIIWVCAVLKFHFRKFSSFSEEKTSVCLSNCLNSWRIVTFSLQSLCDCWNGEIF